jgi:hypothetical protein
VHHRANDILFSQDWRGSDIPPELVFSENFLEIPPPKDIPIEVESGKSTALEIDKDGFSISNGGRIAAGRSTMFATSFHT